MSNSDTAYIPDPLPSFFTGPGETDVLLVVMVIFMIALLLAFGNVYFKLHAIPEKLAHGVNSIQFQLVGILALLALFTHNNLFWVFALLLAVIRIPDFVTPLNTIAEAAQRLTNRDDK
jgi:multisubunit Na+/H+ antiporter MnhF subunit